MIKLTRNTPSLISSQSILRNSSSATSSYNSNDVMILFIKTIAWSLRCLIVREFKIWRRQSQRQRHKSIIWLVEWRKIIVRHVWHAFWEMFWRSLANDDVKFSYLRFWRQRELAAKKSFILCLYIKTNRAKQAKVHSAYFVQRDQHEIIGKDWKFNFNVTFSLQLPS